jgi:hypothetical protein
MPLTDGENNDAVASSAPDDHHEINPILDAALQYATERGWHVFPWNVSECWSYKRAENHGGRRWGMTADPNEIRRDWSLYPDAGIGIATGAESGVIVVETDTKEGGHEHDGAVTLAELEAEYGELPATLQAESPSGSVHYYFNHPGFDVKSIAGKIGPGIDVKADRGMVVGPPSIKPGKGIYQWRNSLPIADAPQWVLDAITREKEAESELPYQPPPYEDDATRNRRERYARIVMEDRCRRLATTAPGHRNEELNKAAFTLGQFIGAGVDLPISTIEAALHEAARANGLVKDTGAQRVRRTTQSGFGKGQLHPWVFRNERAGHDGPDEPNNGTAPPPPRPLGEWDAGLDETMPPPRGWLLGNVFCREFASSVFADGAVGKTSVRYVQLLSLAVSRALTGDHVFQRCRVLIISLEDGAKELRRRILAARIHHGISREELAGWLFLAAPGLDDGEKLLEVDPKGRLVTGGLASRIEEAIVRLKIDIISLDPLVKLHSVGENDNSAMDKVASILTRIAIKHNIAVDVPHHNSKGPSDPGNAKRGRGASSTKDAFRLVYTLTPMGDTEAKDFGLSEAERRYLIRMDSGKVNIAPPSEDATWFKLVGVNIGNGNEQYPNGDNVQTVERWIPPPLFQDVSRPTINDILNEIDAGLPDGNRYTDAPNATERAAWRIVVKHVKDKTTEEARRMIGSWRASGLLIAKDYKNPNTTKKVRGLWVDDSKRP